MPRTSAFRISKIKIALIHHVTMNNKIRFDTNRGIFLKYLKTDIFLKFYFFLNIKKKKPPVAIHGGGAVQPIG